MKRSFWELIKEINSSNLREGLFPGYKINEWIFRGALLFCFVLLIVILVQHDFDFAPKFYFECPNDSDISCQNPFHSNEYGVAIISPSCPEVFPCEQQVFPPGFSFGMKPTNVLKNYALSCFFAFLLAISVNHIGYNIKRKRRTR